MNFSVHRSSFRIHRFAAGVDVTENENVLVAKELKPRQISIGATRENK